MTGAGRGQDPRRGPLTQAVCPGPAVVLGSQPLVLPTVRTRVRQGAGGLPPACTLGVPEGAGGGAKARCSRGTSSLASRALARTAEPAGREVAGPWATAGDGRRCRAPPAGHTVAARATTDQAATVQGPRAGVQAETPSSYRVSSHADEFVTGGARGGDWREVHPGGALPTQLLPQTARPSPGHSQQESVHSLGAALGGVGTGGDRLGSGLFVSQLRQPPLPRARSTLGCTEYPRTNGRRPEETPADGPTSPCPQREPGWAPQRGHKHRTDGTAGPWELTAASWGSRHPVRSIPGAESPPRSLLPAHLPAGVPCPRQG